jgi:hypothetical protein
VADLERIQAATVFRALIDRELLELRQPREVDATAVRAAEEEQTQVR